jgi:transcriptional regulator with XRE-family HTH domain
VPPVEPCPFGVRLRTLRRARGFSLTTLGHSTFYSRGYLSKIELGAKPPTLELAARCDQVLGTGETLTRLAADQMARAGISVAARVSADFVIRADALTTGAISKQARRAAAETRPAWQSDSVVDGADPHRAGCDRDAVAVDGCRVAISDTHTVGQLYLHFSPIGRAAWGRFVPVPTLEHFRRDYRVDILLEMRRGTDHHLNAWQCEYAGDMMWCNLLTVGPVPVGASASVYFDGWLVGQAHTQVLADREGRTSQR